MTLAPTATVTVRSITPTITTAQKLWDTRFSYLSAGVVTMLCLIALALLIIALYYRILMTQSQHQHGGNGNLEKEGDTQMKEQVKLIMLGTIRKKTTRDLEVCDKFQKEIHNNHVGVVVVEGTTSTQENQASQETQQQQSQ
ncbi:unnamed protein product [Lupinus luteus]|uniref:Uncharacterized protein n=1 Tax=Lupinus luteus TaxID=3873 RepID=A0AAV1XRR4_LUPLU